MAAVQQYAGIALRKVAELEKKVSTDLKQLWDNEAELKRGLDAAEFNLRAHQKVLNALAADQSVIWETLKEAVDGFTEERQLSTILLVNPEEGKPDVQRISWPFYHKLVEGDLKEIEEAQKKKQEAQATAAKVNKVKQELNKLVAAAEEAGNDPKEVEAEVVKLLEQTQRVADECGKMLRGEAYDESVIQEAQEVIDKDEARRGNGEAKADQKDAQEGDQKVPVQEESQHPEGAEVFGG